MLYSEMGKTGIRVSRLGLGGMRLPEKDGKIHREPALQMVDAAVEAGVNYFDTAYTYHGGDSEVFFAEALGRHPRESWCIADKLPTWLLKEAADVPRLFDEQLARCGVAYFDFYLLHALDRHRWPAVKATRAWEQLAQYKREGRIRALGFSFHGDLDTFCEIVDACDWDFAQLQLNYVDWEMQNAAAFHDKLRASGIPCVVMEPVRGGFLANLPDVARRELAAANSDSPARWAMRWCMDLENTPVVLSGMSTMEQLRENIAAFSSHTSLTEAERQAVARARAAVLSIKTVPCTACGYCMDCAFGVNIPEVFRIINEYKLFGNQFMANFEYSALARDHDGGACTGCGACAPMCPQGIDIPRRLAEVHEELEPLKKKFT